MGILVINNWPCKELLQTFIGLYTFYIVKRHGFKYYAKFQAYYQNKIVDFEEKDELFQNLKELLFNDLSYLMNGKVKTWNVLEIGIGCGNNFIFYPKSNI